MLKILRIELESRGRRLARRVGWPSPPSLPSSRFEPPDSALARQAAALVHELSPRYLENHCHRTYAFGVALATFHGRRFDAELFYLASLLHDLGLTEAHRGDEAFEIRGARAARRFCVEHGLAPDRADLVHEAIALHTSFVAGQREPEIAYVHFGAGVDVIGYRVEDVARPTIDRILEAWPRFDFKSGIVRDLEPERGNPGSPLTRQWRLGLGKRIRVAPFPE